MISPSHALTLVLALAVIGLACSGISGSQDYQVDLLADSPVPTRTEVSKLVLNVDTVDCGVFDPAVDLWDTGNGIGSPPIVPEIHAGLAKFTDDNVQPVELELASSYSVSNDGRLYTFTLKPDLKFSDGGPVRPSDFMFSWSRALKMGRPDGFAHRYLGGIVGAEDVIGTTPTELAGVEVVDDRTFSVALKEPDFNFLMRVAHPVSFIIERHNAEKWDGIWTNDIDPYSPDAPDVLIGPDQLPVGVGPFKLLSFTSSADERTCVLARNPEYHGHPPQLEHIVMSDKIARLIRLGFAPADFDAPFLKGEVDLNHFVLIDLSDDQMDDLANQRPLGTDAPAGVIRSRTNVELAVLALNPANPHLDDRSTRRAILNNADIESEIYGGDFPLPDRIVPEILQSGINGIIPIDARVADARAISDLAATDEIFSIVDTTDSHRFNYQGFVANLTERWWRDFGLDFRVASAGPTELAAMLEQGEVDARLWQMTLQMPDPLEVLRLFNRPFGDDASAEETVELDELFATVNKASDIAERRAGLAAIEQLVLDAALGATLHWDVGWIPVQTQPYVHGFTGATFPRSMFHSVWMDDTAPERTVP